MFEVEIPGRNRRGECESGSWKDELFTAPWRVTHSVGE